MEGPVSTSFMSARRCWRAAEAEVRWMACAAGDTTWRDVCGESPEAWEVVETAVVPRRLSMQLTIDITYGDHRG